MIQYMDNMKIYWYMDNMNSDAIVIGDDLVADGVLHRIAIAKDWLDPLHVYRPLHYIGAST